MRDLQNIRFNGHTFEYQKEDNYYECRGSSYYDDEHDQVPEPSLQEAAEQLVEHLESQKINASIEWGEKGWIEIMID
tara:strand:+ start:249 stop:479 length:231 start_codon:yes stop_codon:yes gene_type:complete